ncbi:MAG: MFS transporter [Thermomicrobium sp.]|nr:MFS transporter [Thermomicrobium sp.]
MQFEQKQAISTGSVLWIVRILVFATFFDLFVQYPIAAPYASTLGASPAFVGAIVAAYSVANLAGNLVAGIALDRIGRFPLLVAGTFGTAAVVTTYAVVSSPTALFALRLLHGLVVAALAPGSFALSGDSVPAEERARAMGINGAIIAFAAIVAPAFAGIVQERYGFATVFLADALLLAVTGVVVALSVRSVRVAEANVRATSGLAPTWSIVRRLADPYVAVLAFTVALGAFVTALPERLQALGIAPSVRGAAFSTYGIVAALVMVSPLVGRVARRDWARAVTLGLAMIAVGLAVTGADASARGIERLTLGGAGLFGLGFGFLFPALTAEVARRAGRGERGRAFGWFYALYSLGVVAGSLLAGTIGEFFGSQTGWPLVAGGSVSALGAALCHSLSRRRVRNA